MSKAISPVAEFKSLSLDRSCWLWSLAKIDPSWYLSDIIPSTPEGSGDLRIGFYGRSFEEYILPSPKTMHVAKIGRSTGWTTGTRNAIPTVMGYVPHCPSGDVMAWSAVGGDIQMPWEISVVMETLDP